MIFRKILPSAFLLITVLSAFAGTALASDISFFVGAEIPGAIKYNDVKMSLDNSPVYGLRYGRNFFQQISLEHTFAISPDYLFPGSNEGEVTEARGFIYNSNLMLNVPNIDDMIVPFLTAGIGLIHQYGDRNLPVGTKVAFNYGGGAKFPNMVGPLGARIDLRGYRAGVFSKQLNIFEISFGFMVTFGR